MARSLITSQSENGRMILPIPSDSNRNFLRHFYRQQRSFAPVRMDARVQAGKDTYYSMASLPAHRKPGFRLHMKQGREFIA